MNQVYLLAIRQNGFETLNRTAELNQPKYLHTFIETHSSESYFFPSLRTFSLLKFVPLISERRFAPGQTIARQGCPNDSVFILKAGTVTVSTNLVQKDYVRHPLDSNVWQVTCRSRTFKVTDTETICKPGQVFGLAGVLDPCRLNNCTYEADSECEVLVMSIQDLAGTANKYELGRLVNAIKNDFNMSATDHLEYEPPSGLARLFFISLEKLKHEQKTIQSFKKHYYKSSKTTPRSSVSKLPESISVTASARNRHEPDRISSGRYSFTLLKTGSSGFTVKGTAKINAISKEKLAAPAKKRIVYEHKDT